MFVFLKLTGILCQALPCNQRWPWKTLIWKGKEKEVLSMFSSLQLYALTSHCDSVCVFSCFYHNTIYPTACSISGLVLVRRTDFFVLVFIQKSRRKSWKRSPSGVRRCQKDYPAARRGLGQQWRDIFAFLSPQSAESVTLGLLPVGVNPSFQSTLMHNQQGFPFQLNSYAGTLHVLSSMQILLDFPRIWADFLPWIFLYKCL